MSYQALARKWRPQTFADVVGQQHVLTALANGLSLGRIHHAYLFSGTRGVGKTSIARLLAKGLNCEAGVTATPCGVCDHCQQISQGRFIDLIEIDAASRTKVEDTRELLDNVQYAPVRGRYKVYLIDEVHMLSRHSFNALLKTLEEPPEHVKFLLATTDPQKLPVTILSRCLQFHLKALDPGLIRERLESILSAENITFEPRALQLLARAADGSLRDSLSLTDQAIASGGGQVTTRVVNAMLGTLEDDQALSLLEALIQANGEQTLALIDQFASRGIEWDALLVEMLQLLHHTAMAQLVPLTSGNETDIPEQRLRELARLLPPADIQLYYQILLLGRKELPFAPDRRMGVEMTLLRALAFHPKAEQPQPVTTPSGGSLPVVSMPPVQKTTPAAQPQPASVLPQSTTQVLQARNQLQQATRQTQEKIHAPATPQVSAMTTSEKLAAGVVRPVKTPLPASSDLPTATPSPPAKQDYRWQAQNPADNKEASVTTPAALRNTLEYEKTPELAAKIAARACECDPWSEQIARLNLPKLVEQMALNSYLQQQGSRINLFIRSSQRQLNTPAAQKALLQALNELHGGEVELNITEDDNPQHRTPQEWRNAIYAEKLTQARDALTDDNHIQLICQLFDAELDESSIRPI